MIEEGWRLKGWIRDAAIFVGLVAAYVAAAKLGFRAALAVQQVSAAWPPSGLALWAVLVLGRRAWPPIWIGALIANFTTGVPVLPAATIGAGNLLEAIAGAWLLREFAEVDRSLDRLLHITALVVLAAVFSTTIAATIGSLSLCAFKLQHWSQFGLVWRTWWLGDAMGDLLLAPLLLTLPAWLRRLREINWLELAALETVAVVWSILIFTSKASALAAHPLEYAVFPVVIWAGLRFAHPGAALVNSTISRIAIYGTLRGMGPFGTPPVTQDSIVALQIYAGLTAISGLVLGAAVADRRRSELLRQTDHALSTILSSERDIEHATPRILQAVCETLEWEIGILWQANDNLSRLEFVDCWTTRRDGARSAAPLKEFANESRRRHFQRGEGLPGRVWAEGRPLWIDDVTVDAGFPRAALARRVDLHGGFAFPVLVGSRVLGVVEFFTRSPRPVDRSLLTLMEAAGAQIGQFVERRRAEQRVAESEALYSAIVNAALDCIVTVDANGAIREFNPAATHVFGYARDDAIGHQFVDLIVPAPLRTRYREELARYAETGESRLLGQRFELPALRKEGTEFIVEVTVTRVGGPGRRMLTAHMRDITDRKRAEDEREMLLSRERLARRDAEDANRSKDQFLATVSHELRTPLTAILGWASMLKTRRFDPQRVHQIYESLERNAQAQAQIVGDLLDVSRIVTGQLRLDSQTVDVGEIASLSIETIRPAAAAKGITLVARIASQPCLVAGDPARLQQVIWNLLSNAAKFTPSDGTITLRVDREGSNVVIDVADSGIGIAPHLLTRVFDRFWQADGSTTRVHGGLGLGLALVRHLVELHGGEVSAESEGEGRGSRFTVLLPARRADGVPRSNPPRSSRLDRADADLDGISILVVDDDDETRALFVEVLNQRGARLHLAASASEAFDAAARERMDVILMDIGLPQEDGFSLLRRIRQLETARGSAPIPVIAVTAYAGASARDDVMRAGFTSYLAKPVAPDDVVDAISQVLATRSQ